MPSLLAVRTKSACVTKVRPAGFMGRNAYTDRRVLLSNSPLWPRGNATTTSVIVTPGRSFSSMSPMSTEARCVKKRVAIEPSEPSVRVEISQMFASISWRSSTSTVLNPLFSITIFLIRLRNSRFSGTAKSFKASSTDFRSLSGNTIVVPDCASVVPVIHTGRIRLHASLWSLSKRK